MRLLQRDNERKESELKTRQHDVPELQKQKSGIFGGAKKIVDDPLGREQMEAATLSWSRRQKPRVSGGLPNCAHAPGREQLRASFHAPCPRAARGCAAPASSAVLCL